MPSKLRKLLKDDTACNPYNDDFDFPNLLAKVVTGISKAEIENDSLKDVLPIVSLFNQEYKKFYIFLKTAVASCNLPFDKFFQLCFTAFNRNYLVAQKMRISNMKNSEEIHFNRQYSLKVESLSKNVGKIEVSSALESDIDGMNLFFNYLRYLEKEPIACFTGIPEIDSINLTKRIFLASNIFHVMKSEYDNSIWNDGVWSTDLSGSPIRLTIDYEPGLEITRKAGMHRLQTNIITNFYAVVDELNRDTAMGKVMRTRIKSTKQDKRIKSVSVKEGCIEVQLAKGFANKDCFYELNNITATATFYNFLDKEQLPKLTKLALNDLISLFSLLQDLLDQASVLPKDESIQAIADMNKFPIRISAEKLVTYFTQRSTYSTRQVKEFLFLLSSTFGERLNLWDKPLVFFRGYYFVTYTPIVQPVLYNLIDVWLNEAGFSLDQRGIQLEQYLFKKLQKDLARRNFEHFIPVPGKIYNKQKKYEEIDLLLNLKHVVVCAEIKCIKFPMEPRDMHNAVKRLTQAAKQAKRKAEFLTEFAVEISNQTGIIAGKLVIPIIITNNPIYTSYVIDGVVITDFYLFESYFNTGKLSTVAKPRNEPEMIKSEVIYYRNEKEMNEKLESFLKKPPSVDNIKKLFKMVTTPITPDTSGFEILVTSAQYDDSLPHALQSIASIKPGIFL